MIRHSIPTVLVLVLAFAGGSGPVPGQKANPRITVGQPPKDLQFDPFYGKYADAGGIPVVSSKQVPDKALIVAAELVSNMLAKRPDIRQALVDGKERIAVMAKGEVTTDIPEHSKLEPKDHWDKRARGLGGTPYIPTTSCAEENLLGYDDDRYNGENILIHGFAACETDDPVELASILEEARSIAWEHGYRDPAEAGVEIPAGISDRKVLSWHEIGNALNAAASNGIPSGAEALVASNLMRVSDAFARVGDL